MNISRVSRDIRRWFRLMARNLKQIALERVSKVVGVISLKRKRYLNFFRVMLWLKLSDLRTSARLFVHCK